MKERWGIFRGSNENDFESDEDVKRRLALEGQLPPHIDGAKFPKEFEDYSAIARDRSLQSREMSPRTESVVKVHLKRDSTITFIGDTHIGHPNTDYDRIQKEIEVIKNTPNSYVAFTGDLVDGIYWGGASQGEQVLSLDEQYGYMRTLFKKLKGKVLVGVSGEHDSKWASKTGMDPYGTFPELTNAPYIRGIAEMDIDVGKQNYLLVVAHKMQGHSMYTKTHPERRMSKFGITGADVYVGSHTHQKEVSQDAIRNFGGDQTITYISTGPYKTSDDYVERGGYAGVRKNGMGGVSIRLFADEKRVEVEPDILNAHRKWRR